MCWRLGRSSLLLEPCGILFSAAFALSESLALVISQRRMSSQCSTGPRPLRRMGSFVFWKTLRVRNTLGSKRSSGPASLLDVDAFGKYLFPHNLEPLWISNVIPSETFLHHAASRLLVGSRSRMVSARLGSLHLLRSCQTRSLYLGFAFVL